MDSTAQNKSVQNTTGGAMPSDVVSFTGGMQASTLPGGVAPQDSASINALGSTDQVGSSSVGLQVKPSTLSQAAGISSTSNTPAPTQGSATLMDGTTQNIPTENIAQQVKEINGNSEKSVDLKESSTATTDQATNNQTQGDSNVVSTGQVDVPTQNGPEIKAKSAGSFSYSIEELLDIVVQRNASDLHISNGYPAMLRIDGTLSPLNNEIVTGEVAEKLIYPLMPDSKKDALEVNREVDFAYSYGKDARFRINAYYERKHLSAAMRLIPNKIRTLEELNLPPVYSELVKLPQGLVLVTGPTGSGKSTTLAAMLNHINQNRSVHIVTIEDPIEYVYPQAKAMVDQREMHDDTNSWNIALRSVLRQDPDVVLVGEMRDFETIAAAITVAETGHLVFATLHTNSASQSIDRIIDVFPEFQQSQIRLQLSNVIEAVVSQRLVPIIGGGRRAVNEIMLATPAIRNLIREGKSEQIDNAIRTGAEVGMRSLEQSLVTLVREGKLSVDDAQMHTTKPEEVVRLMKG